VRGHVPDHRQGDSLLAAEGAAGGQEPGAGHRPGGGLHQHRPRALRRDAMKTPILFLNVLVIATCGLIYELQAATLSSFVLGDSVAQFSLVIGLYLSALGLGAWLSRFIERGLARAFIEVELGVALVGGLSVPLLYVSYTRPAAFLPLLYGTVV